MNAVRREYVDARRVLLDALVALRPHLAAFVLIGAQAVYLRTVDRLPTYQPFTTDADLMFDPARLADEPLLADAMIGAGFEFSGNPGIWRRTVIHDGAEDVVVPVDLIVPTQIAPPAGRRGARLPGGHGNTAAQKTDGVEGALVDHDPIEIAALDGADLRRAVIEVAGPAALLVAKAFKLGERLSTPGRLQPKDAGDVFRLFEAYPVSELDRRLRLIEGDARSAAVASTGLDHLRALFATPRSSGIDLAVAALGHTAERTVVTATMVACTRELLASR